MPKDASRAEIYRLRGEELRVIADGMKNKETRQTLLDVAGDYDRMADQVDRMGRDKPQANPKK